MAVRRNARGFCPVAASSVAVVDPLPAAALGRVFGRDHVVHVAIAPGRLADRLAIEAERLGGLRRTDANDQTDANDRTDANKLNDDRVTPGHMTDGASG